MKLESSYQSEITYYQNKINAYNREASKHSKEQSVTFKTTNVANYHIQLAYYQKKEKKRLQKLALIQACESVSKGLKPEAKKTKQIIVSDSGESKTKLASFKGKQMIQGKSGKKLEQSVSLIKIGVNLVASNGQSFS